MLQNKQKYITQDDEQSWNKTPLIARFEELCSSVCTRCRSTMLTNWSSDWLTFGAVLSTLPSASGNASVGVSSRESMPLWASAVGCYDDGMKLSIDSLYTICIWNNHMTLCKRCNFVFSKLAQKHFFRRDGKINHLGWMDVTSAAKNVFL